MNPSPYWCLVCRQRGYASAACAAVAERREWEALLDRAAIAGVL